jgi:hypothetical protein
MGQPANTITFTAGPTEMIRINESGFWVRGIRVTQDDKESQIVYNAFKQWLEWSILNKEQ